MDGLAVRFSRYKKDLSFDSDSMLCNFVWVFVFREIKTQMDYNWQIKKNQSLKGKKKQKLWNLRGGEREKEEEKE